MKVEPVILDGDDGVSEVGGDAFERNITALFVETEPRPPVRIVEDRVTDAAIEAVYRPGMPDGPRGGQQQGNDQHATGDGDQPVTD